MRRFGWIVLLGLLLACGEVGGEEPAGSTPSTSASATESPTSQAPTTLPPTATPAPEPSSTALPTDASAEPVIATGQGNADVIFVRAVLQGESWTFHVTVAHPDTGWEDYADGWDVVLPDGTVLRPDESSPFTRLLLHPHETEQPFTRSQSGIVIPAEVATVTVRAHDLVDGFGGQEIVVDLAQAEGDGFRVER